MLTPLLESWHDRNIIITVIIWILVIAYLSYSTWRIYHGFKIDKNKGEMVFLTVVTFFVCLLLIFITVVYTIYTC